MDMNSSSVTLACCCSAWLLLACVPEKPELGAIDSGCVARVSASADGTLLVQRLDQTLWAEPNGAPFAQVVGPDGPLLATDSAASGASASGGAIGCAVVFGNAWCFSMTGADSAPKRVTALGTDAAPLTGVTQIAGGTNDAGATFCAVTSDGKAWCWGDDSSGLLIQGDDTSDARPVQLDANTEFSDAAEVRVGFDSACIRRSEGSVWCWGNDQYGQLGSLPSSGDGASVYPLQVPLPAAATRLAASPGNTQCAILADTRVVCWGRNEAAEAGASSEALRVPPTIVKTEQGGADLSAVVDLAPDRALRATCANTENAGLWCWGDVLTDDATATSRVSPYPVQLVTSPQSRISVPLSAYGGDIGKLVYINADGRLVFGASSMPSARQPPCP